MSTKETIMEGKITLKKMRSHLTPQHRVTYKSKTKKTDFKSKIKSKNKKFKPKIKKKSQKERKAT